MVYSDPHRHRSPGKSGKNSAETIEEIMKSHEIPIEYLTFGRVLGQVSGRGYYNYELDD